MFYDQKELRTAKCVAASPGSPPPQQRRNKVRCSISIYFFFICSVDFFHKEIWAHHATRSNTVPIHHVFYLFSFPRCKFGALCSVVCLICPRIRPLSRELIYFASTVLTQTIFPTPVCRMGNGSIQNETPILFYLNVYLVCLICLLTMWKLNK